MDVTMVLAQDAVKTFDIRDGEGKLLVPCKAPEMNGRGIPAAKGEEPDYRGVVGYMSLQSDWEVSRFSTFTRIPWMLPVYDEDGETVVGEIQHKTPVLGYTWQQEMAVVRSSLQKTRSAASRMLLHALFSLSR